MPDTDNQTIEIRSITIAGAHMTFNGWCDKHEDYVPSFPLFINGIPQPGFPCGRCLTEFVRKIRAQDPTVDIRDFRYVLYN